MKSSLLGPAFLLGIVSLTASVEAAGPLIPDDEREARRYEQAVYRGVVVASY